MTDDLAQLRLEDAPVELDTPALLTPDSLIVRLNKVFSWQQSASRWPYYLSRAEAGRVYTRHQIIRDVFNDAERRHEEPIGKGWLTSIFGLIADPEAAEVRIEGIGMIDRVAGDLAQYVISDDGLALAHAYSSEPDSEEWKRVFAGILARNDARVRAVLLHLARWGAYLVFSIPSAQGFFALHSGGALRLPDEQQLPLFRYAKNGNPAYSFTPILRRDAYAVLGPFLRAKIACAGVCTPERVEFQGGRAPLGKEGGITNPEPSGNDLRLYMKQALSLFRDIGALVYVEHRQGWTLDAERCATLFEPALVADLFGERHTDRFLDALRAACAKLSDSDGYVRVTDIRDYVADELDISPGERVKRFDTQVAYYLRPDVARLRLGRTFHAQATPDECLFGNLEMEYVEFLFA